MVKSKFAAFAAASALLLVFACSKATPPGFVKYKSEGDVPRVSVPDAKADQPITRVGDTRHSGV